MVRLITHNLLACHARNCTANNFPLIFQDAKIEILEANFNAPFIRAFVPKIDWKALVTTAHQLGNTSLPLEQPETMDEEFMRKVHHVLLEIDVMEGAMLCPNCGHNFAITEGIPNMLLGEHEV